MKLHTIYLIVILSLTSCITTTNVHYSDPNYLNSDEFSTYQEITQNTQQEETPNSDTTIHDKSNNYITDNNYYDYHFSSRIRRFHRPMHYSSYYNGLYTDYYWYNNNPLYYGTSIYYGYNWHSPYYSYYSYSPYYNYYNPYYADYYSYYGYNYYHPLNNNTNNHNAYITGNRSSLTTSGRDIKIKPNKNRSTLNTRTNQQEKNSQYRVKNNSTKRKNNTFRDTPNIKRNPKDNRTHKVRTNLNKRNNNQFSNSSNKRTNSQNMSGNRKRHIKPRR